MYEYIVRQKLGVASRFDSVVSRRAIDPWFVVGVLLIAVHVLPVDLRKLGMCQPSSFHARFMLNGS